MGAHTKALSLLAFRFLPSTQEHIAHDEVSSDDNRSVEALLPNDDNQSISKTRSGTLRGSSIASTTFRDVPIDDRGCDEPRGMSNDGEDLQTLPPPPPIQGSGSWGFIPKFRDIEEKGASPQEPDAKLKEMATNGSYPPK